MSEQDQIGDTARSIANMLEHFGTGPRAELRRMDETKPAPAFWRLAARHDALSQQPEAWVPIVRAFALLMAKGVSDASGDPENRITLHDGKAKLGRALCDGGDPSWTGQKRPLISERRLAQILAARGLQRTVLLTRAIRALAAKKPSRAQIDVVDLTWAFLNSKNPEAIALPYYIRLDAAVRAAAKESQNA